MHCLADNPEDTYCKVLLLDDTELVTEIKSSAKGEFLLNWVFDRLNLQENDYFGLRYLDQTNQTQWVDPTKTIKTQLKVGAPYTVYFGVKFYAADPCLLKEELTRYQFFLQVKRDILQGRLPVTFDQAAELCAYAVQSELGDYDPRRHSFGYVSEFRLVPNQTTELEDRIHQIHRTLAGMVPALAEHSYLDTVKWFDMYGVDLHQVLGEGAVEYFLGLTPTGVVVYKNKSKVGNYFWPRIVKVTFKNKNFMIRVKDKNNYENTYTFECPTKQGCKHLWKCCVEHHAFFRLSHVAQPSGNFFQLGSKYRYSGRTEKQALSDAAAIRPEPQVLRTPSRRHQRRSAGSDSGLEQTLGTQYSGSSRSMGTSIDPNMPVSKFIQPEPVIAIAKARSSGHESPHSNRSAPWENESQSTGGLYTRGHDSPYSNHSEKMMFPRRVPSTGSESEKTDRRHRSRRDTDENEAPRRRRRRSKESNKSNNSDLSEQSKSSRGSSKASKGSKGSKGSSSSRKYHRNRKRSSKNEEMVDSETQWKEVQRRQSERENIGPQDAVVKDLRLQNGSVRSLQSNDSKESHEQRRLRRRSRSPGKRPPEELKQHFQYELVDPEPLTEEQKRDIPYMAVETKAEPFRIKYSPHTRHKRRTSPYRKSGGPGFWWDWEGMEYVKPNGTGTTPTSPDAPPPYSSMMENRRSYNSDLYNGGGRKDEVETMVHPSAPTVYKQELHSAPIVKTKKNVYASVGHNTRESPASNPDYLRSHVSHIRQFGDASNRPKDLPVRSNRPYNSNDNRADIVATYYVGDPELKSSVKSRSMSPPDRAASKSQNASPVKSSTSKSRSTSPPDNYSFAKPRHQISSPSSPPPGYAAAAASSSVPSCSSPGTAGVSPSRAFQPLPQDLNYGLKLAPMIDVATEL
ncbi:band 4.1-like protein 4 isoform X1 [Tubulanus polymorphus]|uniref:band 4.1-like protein 4 isoform X1 n=1 Tax=Tubulanus polymorphus TaxID=672921 RepID=UPI003DA62D7A